MVPSDLNIALVGITCPRKKIGRCSHIRSLIDFENHKATGCNPWPVLMELYCSDGFNLWQGSDWFGLFLQLGHDPGQSFAVFLPVRWSHRLCRHEKCRNRPVQRFRVSLKSRVRILLVIKWLSKLPLAVSGVGWSATIVCYGWYCWFPEEK